MDVLTRQIASGLVWRYSERFGNQFMQLAISMVMARILLPSDFGTIALNTFFLVIASLLADSGLVSAVIQKKNIDQLDLSTTFYTNIFFSVLIYLFLFSIAPFIARFYEIPIVAPLLRVQSLILLLSAFNGVQRAMLSRKMLFKKSFRITFSATIVNGIVGVSMAFSGYGLWSLVFAQLASSLTSTIVIWKTIGWRPTWEFSYERFKGLFGFSFRFMGVGLLTAIYNNILSVIIGKRYSSTDLGFYNRGQNLAALAIDNLGNSIGQVLLPALSSCQDNKNMVVEKFKQAIIYSSYGIFFLLIMMIVMAKPLILVLYGTKWDFSIPFLQIACIGYFFYAFNQINQIVICSIGRSDLHLRYDLIKKGVMTLILVATIPFGIYWMVFGYSISMIITAFISTIPTGRHTGYGLLQQLKDIYLSLLAAIVAGLCAWPFAAIIDSSFLTLIVQFSIGAAVYALLSVLLHLKGIQPIIRAIKHFYKKTSL